MFAMIITAECHCKDPVQRILLQRTLRCDWTTAGTSRKGGLHLSPMATEDWGKGCAYTAIIFMATQALRMIDVTKFLDTESRRRSKSFSQPGRLKSFDEHIIYPSSLPPLLSLTISSEHTLQLTLTKTSLEILMELQKVITIHNI